MYNVLLVDDESWVVESLKDLIDWNAHGFQVAGQAYSGMDALGSIRALKPDVVFTDIRMPEMNGLELIQRGIALPFPVQFVVASGYAEFAYAQKALAYGAAAYCLKPFDEAEISGVLRKIRVTLDAARPAAASPLLHLLEDPGAGGEQALLEQLKAHGLADWDEDRTAAVVAVGTRELPDMDRRVVKLKTGTFKTAYLLTGRQIDALRIRWEGGLPPGLTGIGISGPIAGPKAIKPAIDAADELAHQTFVTFEPGIYAARQPFKTDELNRLLGGMRDAIRVKDHAAAALAFERIGQLFAEKALSVRHAFQVYNMTVSFLFELGQSETMLYSYEQLVQAHADVFAMLEELMALTARCLGQAGTPPVETKNQTFRAILQYVTDHYRGEISLQHLADRFYMNPSYISQLFKKEVGETLTAYLSRLRIAYACELLEKEVGSIQDIAEQTGYRDYFYFTRLFKKVTGKTPAQYRSERA
ncbi:response regulator transcription factor [Paenibacillus humicola]|uniref:response regulator transcription factor n=1 Tax=Paenibacillus humicola TaxID=3110540 RepID=UPI00237B45AC|nr:helix-turn-helix domain-containing protein [Paenibacillus humicola]